MTIKFVEDDGDEIKVVTKREIKAWIKRCREGLRDFEVALRGDDPQWMCEVAVEITGSGAALQNIAETTNDREVRLEEEGV